MNYGPQLHLYHQPKIPKMVLVVKKNNYVTEIERGENQNAVWFSAGFPNKVHMLNHLFNSLIKKASNCLH